MGVALLNVAPFLFGGGWYVAGLLLRCPNPSIKRDALRRPLCQTLGAFWLGVQRLNKSRFRAYRMKNKKAFLSNLFCLFLLGGCSSHPDVDDVKDGIIEAWKPCQSFVKPIGFKKLNGIDNGKTYQLDVNYQLLITADIPAAKAFGGESLMGACLAGGASVGDATGMMDMFANLVMKNANVIQNKVIKSGQTLDVTTSYDMIKSEKGWIIQ